MNRVFVLDTKQQPLPPVHPAEARLLLTKRQAAVFRRFPFTIILANAVSPPAPRLRLKLDPGSRATGIVLVDEERGAVIFAAEIEHRGDQVQKALATRRALRRSRRCRKARHRQPRFQNRRRRKGWLPPSRESRIANTLTWVNRLRRLAPVASLSVEMAQFDTQALENPEIGGVEYQQGELLGYEVREYLLEKWGRHCAYCGAARRPLEVEHLVPRTRGGSDRISNLTLACHECNAAKGRRTAAEFGHPELQARAKQPLRDMAAVNATRWVILERLKATGLPVECGSGGRTKYNRVRQGYPKGHWVDAACVGETGGTVRLDPGTRAFVAKATGHGRRQRCGTDRYGFPIRHAPRGRSYAGLQTGDLVRAAIPRGKHAGRHTGRIAIRFRPSFRLGEIDVHPKYLTILQRSDGYAYGEQATSPVA